MTSKRSIKATYTEADVAAAIASIDRLSQRASAIISDGAARKGKRRKLRPDRSAVSARLAKIYACEPKPNAPIEPQSTSRLRSPTSRPSRSPTMQTPTAPGYSPQMSCCDGASREQENWQTNCSSFDPQERYDSLRSQYQTDGTVDYSPDGSGGYGEDVDAAFEACSNAPI